VRVKNGVAHCRIFGGINSFGWHQLDDYLRQRPEIKWIKIEILSEGGDVYDANFVISLFAEWKSQGRIVETRVMSTAQSSAFVIAANGSKGYRYIAPTASMALHEIYFTEKDKDPTRATEREKFLKHFQTVLFSNMIRQSKMSEEELLSRIVGKKEFYLSGVEAVEWGFMDKLIFKEEGKDRKPEMKRAMLRRQTSREPHKLP